MEIQKLSKKYMVRKLNDIDIDKIYEVMQGNPMYFQYCPPMATAQSIAEDMDALPPRTTYDDKHYIGYFEGEKLVAVMDLILNFPNKETAFVGFFMMNTAYQGKGIGTEIFEECCKTLAEEKYHYIRLGFVKGNPQSEAFWIKNGFVRTGVEDVQERYTVVVMERQI
ncbi:MAG: GNAT family N-acetyltransferase [Agathobacter sp.]|nr:GNAT family N-acetyltransferase [Agathobacter sp.]